MTDDGSQTAPTADNDTSWRTAVERHFPKFLAFYFPEAFAPIDWARGYRFPEVWNPRGRGAILPPRPGTATGRRADAGGRAHYRR